MSLARRHLHSSVSVQQKMGDGMPLRRTSGRVTNQEPSVSFAAAAFSQAVSQNPAEAAHALRVR